VAINGACLCGGVKFEIDEARSLTYCHCSNCRKLSGAHVASYVHVDADQFRLLAGEHLIQSFESAPGSFRNFCRVCSSTVSGKAAYLTTVSIPAGLLDDDPGVRPKLHVFAPKCRGSKSMTAYLNTRHGCQGSDPKIRCRWFRR
jgi:hypothetical protein